MFSSEQEHPLDYSVYGKQDKCQEYSNNNVIYLLVSHNIILPNYLSQI